MSKIGSKKEIAQEFFRSLDQNTPWKLRLSQTIDHMQEKFPKGQTERVVYQYIRELIANEDRPSPSAPSIRDAISAKIGGLRQSKEIGSKFSYMYQNHGLVQKLLMCGDLYTSDFDYNNRNYFHKVNGDLITNATLPTHTIKYDNAVAIIDRIDFSRYPKIFFKDIFPYFEKSFLETPISLEELVSLSGDLLSQSEILILEEAFSHGNSFPKAIESISGEIKKNFMEEIRQEFQTPIVTSPGILSNISDKVITYAVAIVLTIGLYSCVKLNEGSSYNSTEDRYIERCMANGTPQSVCDQWYDEIEQSITER